MFEPSEPTESRIPHPPLIKHKRVSPNAHKHKSPQLERNTYYQQTTQTFRCMPQLTELNSTYSRH